MAKNTVLASRMDYAETWQFCVSLIKVLKTDSNTSLLEVPESVYRVAADLLEADSRTMDVDDGTGSGAFSALDTISDNKMNNKRLFKCLKHDIDLMVPLGGKREDSFESLELLAQKVTSAKDNLQYIDAINRILGMDFLTLTKTL